KPASTSAPISFETEEPFLPQPVSVTAGGPPKSIPVISSGEPTKLETPKVEVQKNERDTPSQTTEGAPLEAPPLASLRQRKPAAEVPAPAVPEVVSQPSENSETVDDTPP